MTTSDPDYIGRFERAGGPNYSVLYGDWVVTSGLGFTAGQTMTITATEITDTDGDTNPILEWIPMTSANPDYAYCVGIKISNSYTFLVWYNNSGEILFTWGENISATDWGKFAKDTGTTPGGGADPSAMLGSYVCPAAGTIGMYWKAAVGTQFAAGDEITITAANFTNARSAGLSFSITKWEEFTPPANYDVAFKATTATGTYYFAYTPNYAGALGPSLFFFFFLIGGVINTVFAVNDYCVQLVAP
jgi:hypothetical protein